MTMYGNVFCDTNVVIRLNVTETPEYAYVRSAIAKLIADQNRLWISRQVLREFCMVLTRPQVFPIPPRPQDVASRARALASLFEVADETQAVTDHLLNLLETIPMGGKQVYDANLVATMLASGIQHIFTLNPSDFLRFSAQINVITLDSLLSNGS
ncbi:MAG: PIN domain-containing protein [Anaerolineae bacterium]|nr:PIN domain-containing protein [Anaerolineae bacterium]